MPYTPINIGSAPNDHHGTPLRTAFGMINSMFVELFAGGIAVINNLVDGGTTAPLSAEMGKLLGTRTGPWLADDGTGEYTRMVGVTSMPTIDRTINGQMIKLTTTTPATINLPADASEGLSFAVQQRTTNAITFAADVAASIHNSADAYTTTGRYAVAVCSCVGNIDGSTAEWWVTGDLQA